MKRLKDNSDVPKARLGILPKTFTNSKRKQNYILLALGGVGIASPAEEWVLPAASTKEPEER